MPRRVPLKDHHREQRLFVRRTLAALLFFLVLLLVLIGQMIHLQILSHDHYVTLSEDNRVRLAPIPPTRGLIYDRNGVVLAENLPAYRLVIVPEQVRSLDHTLAELARLIEISDNDLKRFHRLYNRKRRFEGVPLRFRLSEDEVARLAVNQHRLPGAQIEPYLSRHYPQGEHAVHAIGYVGRINARELAKLDATDYSGTSHIGKTGVERAYENLLHGHVGVMQQEVNAQGRALRVLERTPPQPGHDLWLTLDIELQIEAEAAFGDHSGSLVAIDPANGEVLAIVSRPGYDPNLFVNGISGKDYRKLREDPRRPLFDRALRGQYPPGSTLKPFIGLAGLEYGVTTPRSRVFCPGYFTLPNQKHRYRDWKKTGHGSMNLHDAIVQSCDVYYYDLALKLGIDRLHDYLARFGFGARTGIDLPGEQSGLLPSRQWKRAVRNQSWFPGETLIAGIGQGFNTATPLQLAAATAALANAGTRIRPHLVAATRFNGDAPRPRPVEALPPVEIRQPAHWHYMIEAMTDVVHGYRGTARRIGRGASYRMAGKTGTAQVFGIAQEEEYEEDKIARKLRDHALFIAFAPVDEPRIAVAVIVENGGSGGAVAAPIARRIMDRYLLDNPS